MRKPGQNKLKGAPLASFESFLSLETRLDEGTHNISNMRVWNDNDRQQQQRREIAEAIVDEPWASAEFATLSRRQQNCEIYRVSPKKQSFSFIPVKEQ